MSPSRGSLTLFVLLGIAACGNGAGDAAQRTASSNDPRPLAEGRTPRADTTAAPGDTIWTGRSGGYAIEWTRRDIVARNEAGTRVLSLRAALDSTYGATLIAPADSGGAESDVCDLSEDIKILSVVGPIMSLERMQYLSCRGAAHPSLVARYVAIDLTPFEHDGIVTISGAGDLGGVVSLTDLFPDEQVLAALLGDRLVQKRIEEIRGRTIRPRTTAELVALLKGGSECEYTFESDMLRRFAFHHVEGDRVAVRIGLSHGCEAARGRLTQIGILLPIPPALHAAFDAASRGTQGVLMREASKRFSGSVTHAEYRMGVEYTDPETP